jgi:hypothetical protein
MNKEFVNYEIALSFKVMGFDKILCYGFYFGTEDLIKETVLRCFMEAKNIQNKTSQENYELLLTPIYFTRKR